MQPRDAFNENMFGSIEQGSVVLVAGPVGFMEGVATSFCPFPESWLIRLPDGRIRAATRLNTIRVKQRKKNYGGR